MKHRAVIGGLALAGLIGGLVLAGGPVSAEQAAVAPTASAEVSPGYRAETQPRLVLDLLKFGYDAYLTYSDCLGNLEMGKECLARDSDNIRDVLKQLGELRVDIQAKHDAVMARLALLQSESDQQSLQTYVQALQPLDAHAVDAMRAWEALSACLLAQNAGKRTCSQFTGIETPDQPIADATRLTRLYLLDEVKRMSEASSLKVYASNFTGTAANRGHNGLAYRAWVLNRRHQDAQAGGDPAVHQTQILTPELATTTNAYLAYYQDLFIMYGFLKPLAQGLKGDSDRAGIAQTTVQTVVYGTDRYTINGAVDHFRLPTLSAGQLIVLSKGLTSGWRIHTGIAPRAVSGAWRNLTADALFEVGRRFESAGYRVSKLRAAQPSAFPAAGGLFAVDRTIWRDEVCPRDVNGFICPGDATARWRWVNTLRPTGDAYVRTVRMSLTDTKPTWNPAYEKSVYYGAKGNFKDSFESVVTGPATYDWEVISVPTSFGTSKVGPGMYVTTVNRSPDLVKDLVTIPPVMTNP